MNEHRIERELAGLLRAAGPRAEVPNEELATIRAGVREAWLETVRREGQRNRFRTIRNIVALAASVLIAVAIGWWLKPGGAPKVSEIVASVELVRGEIRVRDVALTPGIRLEAGAVIETGAGADSPARLAVRLASGQSVRVDAGTTIRLVSGSRMDLERGGVYVDSATSAAGTSVVISTPHGLVRDVGTQFEVRVEDGAASDLTVRVRQGKIELERGAGADLAGAGEELRLQGGTLDRTSVEPSGAVWSWILEVTPVMNIEAATLASYLEWVARETGRTLRYGTGSLAVSSESILVHGSIEGMTPEESLDVVLPGSGFAYRVENGELLIEAP